MEQGSTQGSSPGDMIDTRLDFVELIMRKQGSLSDLRPLHHGSIDPANSILGVPQSRYEKLHLPLTSTTLSFEF